MGGWMEEWGTEREAHVHTFHPQPLSEAAAPSAAALGAPGGPPPPGGGGERGDVPGGGATVLRRRRLGRRAGERAGAGLAALRRRLTCLAALDTVEEEERMGLALLPCGLWVGWMWM